MSQHHVSGERHPASFRDPSGFLFRRDGVLYRYVAREYLPHLERLHASGLYDVLVADRRLVSHERVLLSGSVETEATVLRPELVPFVSYPYEWCFGELREAALLTLDLMETALSYGLILKDASAFNVQFVGTRPVFIDTLSFEAYVEGRPWVAYRQFCEQFLAPLALMAYRDLRLGREMRAHLDGIPLDLAVRLLPGRTWLNAGLAIHLHLHSRGARALAGRSAPRFARLSRTGLLGILASLKATVRRLKPGAGRSVWLDYQDTCTYSEIAREQKRSLVAKAGFVYTPRLVWDLGANTGELSQTADRGGSYVVGFDHDPAVVETAFRRSRHSRSEHLLSLVMDLADPSPALGWAGRERDSLEARGPADLVLALALVHHLAIGRNVPLPDIARWLATCGRTVLVEFVPKSDPQVQRMLSSRDDVFLNYSEVVFEQELQKHFRVDESCVLPDSGRRLFLGQRLPSFRSAEP